MITLTFCLPDSVSVDRWSQECNDVEHFEELSRERKLSVLNNHHEKLEKNEHSNHPEGHVAELVLVIVFGGQENDRHVNVGGNVEDRQDRAHGHSDPETVVDLERAHEDVHTVHEISVDLGIERLEDGRVVEPSVSRDLWRSAGEERSNELV